MFRMNTLFHFLFSYIVVDLVYGNAQPYIIPIALASVLIDLDHLPYILRMRTRLIDEGLGELSRTFLHETPGLVLVSLILLPLYFILQDQILVRVVILSVLLHYVLDFSAGKSRPFHPFSKLVMTSPWVAQELKIKILFEICATIIGGVVFWLLLQA